MHRASSGAHPYSGAPEQLLQLPLLGRWQTPERQTLSAGQSALVAQALPAWALFTSPRVASAIPARPTPNFLSAPRRVTDWAMFLASSSNLSFIVFLSFSIFGFRSCAQSSK